MGLNHLSPCNVSTESISSIDIEWAHSCLFLYQLCYLGWAKWKTIPTVKLVKATSFKERYWKKAEYHLKSHPYTLQWTEQQNLTAKTDISTFGENQVWKRSPKFWLQEQELQGTLFAGSEAHENLPLPFSPDPQAKSPSLGDQPSTSSALFSLDSRRNQLSRKSNLIHSTMKVFDFLKYCKKFSKYLSRLQQPVQNLLQQIPMGKGW